MQDVVPYLQHIVGRLSVAAKKYNARNMLILYDAFGVLAHAVGSHLNREEYIRVIMPILSGKWVSVADGDRALLPLLECLACIARAIGLGFVGYSGPIFQRCIKIIHAEIHLAANVHRTIEEGVRSQKARGGTGACEAELRVMVAHAHDSGSADFAVCAMELIGSMVECLGPHAETLFVAEPKCVHVLVEAMGHPSPDVRQSAFALVGDIFKCGYNIAEPAIPTIVRIVDKYLDPAFNAVCINAVWCLGEIAVSRCRHAHLLTAGLISRVINVMLDAKNRSLKENCAITIGRLIISLSSAMLTSPVPPIVSSIPGVPAGAGAIAASRVSATAAAEGTAAAAAIIAPALPLPPEAAAATLRCIAHLLPVEVWCNAIAGMRPGEGEKEQACRALVYFSTELYPMSMSRGSVLHGLVRVILSWEAPSIALCGMFRKMLQQVRCTLPQLWKRCINDLPQDHRETILRVGS